MIRPVRCAASLAHVLRTADRRSPKWPTERKHWLDDHPACAACGGLKLPEVHHVVPFEHQKSLELDRRNFITLCHWRACHLLIGHGDSFEFYNPFVRRLVADVVAGRKTLDQAAQIAKEDRQPIRLAA